MFEVTNVDGKVVGVFDRLSEALSGMHEFEPKGHYHVWFKAGGESVELDRFTYMEDDKFRVRTSPLGGGGA